MLKLDRLPPLSPAVIGRLARPGESWPQARERLEAARYSCSPLPCTDCGDEVHHYAHEPAPCLCLDCQVELLSELPGWAAQVSDLWRPVNVAPGSKAPQP